MSLFIGDIILFVKTTTTKKNRKTLMTPEKKNKKKHRTSNQIFAGYKTALKDQCILIQQPGSIHREIRKTISFTEASEKMKCLGINLTKELKNLYTKNYKTLLKEIKEDINKWKDSQ